MIEINLKKLEKNLEYFASSGKEIIAVVKNNAYGHGAVPIAQALIKAGIKYLFVNELYEAIPLLEAGIKLPILVHNSIKKNELSYLIKYPNIYPTINSYDDYLLFLAEPKINKLYISIQIDTNMNRLGFKEYDEFIKVLDLLKVHQKFIITGIYTHFSSVEMMNIQVQRFKKFAESYPFSMVHCAASATTHLVNYGNFARVGLGLYDHEQVMSVVTKAIKIHKLKAGETVGYNEAYIAKEDELIAVLPIGYGDGYSRKFEGFKVYANGKTYPIVGRICMNHLFVKVDKKVTMDTNFELLSSNLPTSELANYLKTINYEIYTMWQYRKVVYKN